MLQGCCSSFWSGIAATRRERHSGGDLDPRLAPFSPDNAHTMNEQTWISTRRALDHAAQVLAAFISSARGREVPPAIVIHEADVALENLVQILNTTRESPPIPDAGVAEQ